MPDWKKHCDDCRKAGLSREWDVVHRWLDEFAPLSYPSHAHRAYRHHKEGIEEVRRKWGDEAARAAEIHILADIESNDINDIPDEEFMCKKYNVNTKSS